MNVKVYSMLQLPKWKPCVLNAHTISMATKTVIMKWSMVDAQSVTGMVPFLNIYLTSKINANQHNINIIKALHGIGVKLLTLSFQHRFKISFLEWWTTFGSYLTGTE